MGYRCEAQRKLLVSETLKRTSICHQIFGYKNRYTPIRGSEKESTFINPCQQPEICENA